jgi:3-hydroxybutyryl-CoA dehydrogenase
MGSQIAAQCALSNFNVVLVDATEDQLASAVASNAGHLQRRVTKGTLTQDEVAAALSRVTASTDFHALHAADIVIEAVYESLDVKREVFATLSATCLATTILGSNSSTFPVLKIAPNDPHPERLCNLHFFHPVLVMKLVEIMRGPSTSDEVIARCVQFVNAIGRTPVVIGRELSGLIVNRILAAIKREALWLADEGYATPEDIDTAVKLGLNHPMGPFELTDLSGVDIFYQIMLHRFAESGDPQWKPPRILEEKVNAGHLGRKTGRGFYDHSADRPN